MKSGKQTLFVYPQDSFASASTTGTSSDSMPEQGSTMDLDIEAKYLDEQIDQLKKDVKKLQAGEPAGDYTPPPTLRLLRWRFCLPIIFLWYSWGKML